jgi:hypothetical protein
MRKWLMAFLAVAAISLGVAWAEGKSDQGSKACPTSADCCCCTKSCPK